MNPRLYLVAALTLLIFSLAACGSSTGEAAPANLQEVSVQLTGPHGPEFAGLYMAVANGYYQAEGLSVKLIESGLAMDEADSLEQGLVDFSLYQANQAEPITAEDDLTVIAAIFQFPPPVFFSLANSGPQAIVKPQDFAGKRIGVSAPIWRERVAQMMQNVGLNPASATLVDVSPAKLEPLYTGEVDVWSGYLNQEVIQAKLDGKKLSLIFPHEYGLDNYDQLMVAQNKTIAQNPELVGRFVRATLKGWQAAIEYPEEAGAIIAQWQPARDVAYHTTALNLLIPLVDTSETPIGWIEEARWVRIMANAGVTPPPAFSMEFVKSAQP